LKWLSFSARARASLKTLKRLSGVISNGIIPENNKLDDWQKTIFLIYQVAEMTIKAIKALKKIRRIIPRDYTITEIRDQLQSGELHFGDKITVLGTFSEYVPFIDPKYILKEVRSFPKSLPRTTRLEAIDDVYCGALFSLDQKDSFTEEVIPIFYGIDSRMLEHSTGEMLETKCKITQVPMMYRNLINRNELFAFEKEDNVTVPFGLQVLDVEPYGLVDSFRINAWLIGNLNPPPLYEAQKQSCYSCSRFFSYMSIDPLGWPPKDGCSSDNLDHSEMPKEMKKSTEEYLKLEEKGNPYVVFPNPFSLFEVFCPNVDLFNADQRKHSQNLLVGAIQQNIQRFFQFALVFPPELKVPEKIEVGVDFQYDQRKKFTVQSFDPKKIPKWECPTYAFDPNWEEKIARLDKG